MWALVGRFRAGAVCTVITEPMFTTTTGVGGVWFVADGAVEGVVGYGLLLLLKWLDGSG